jgi:hypothetical protein
MAKGDHIYVNRFGGAYSHHGIDCGDGTVVHYTSDHWLGMRSVQHTDIDKFTRGDEIQVRDYDSFYEAMRNPDFQQSASIAFSRMLNFSQGIDLNELDISADAVVERALSRVGEGQFHWIFNNCEHFATWCKTGIFNSEQVNTLWKMVLTGPGFYRYRSKNLLLNLFEPKLPWMQ